MKVLLACEESQTVLEQFRLLGHDAYSCDIQPSSHIDKNLHKYHLQQDIIPLLNEDWDLIIAFPPCTHLAVSGAKHFEQKRKDGRQQQGIDFFNLFTNLKCGKVAIENPIGIMSNIYKKPDQIIQPWQFGDSYQKSTCLWLKGLPKLIPTKIVDKGEIITFASGKKLPKWYSDNKTSKVRSKTFPGIAKAMAEQWGEQKTREIEI